MTYAHEGAQKAQKLTQAIEAQNDCAAILPPAFEPRTGVIPVTLQHKEHVALAYKGTRAASTGLNKGPDGFGRVPKQ